ncbi:MAG: adenylate/guanylate cyclase domain-containing protein, partial [Clostridia bacterium]|nr:adenylate/guanylate cyclase domain-containing protein [Clostridia bacterium]
GPWPWSREVYGRLLEQLALAPIVSFDLILDVPGDPEGDQAFVRSMAEHGGAVLATMFSFFQEDGEVYTELLVPADPFWETLLATGFVNTPQDPDNKVRNITPVDLNLMDEPYPSLSIATSLLAMGHAPDDLELMGGSLRVGERVVPLTGDGRLLLDFYGPAETIPTYSLADVVFGRVPPEEFRDKVVLVGVTSPLFHDQVQTPFTKGNLVLDGKLAPPGVELHATVVENMLHGEFFNRAPTSLNLALIVLGGFLALFLTAKRNPWTGLAITVGILVLFTATVTHFWFRNHYWINLAAPALSVSLTYVGLTIEGYVRAEMDRRKTKALFGRYVSPAVVEQLLTNPGQVELGGIRQDVTVMFSDIRGFTSYSEGRPPEEVVQRLNEYMTEMTAIIFRHGGMLDKYLGDGLMAVFGAPIPYPDHARRALAASLEMQDRLEELNQIWIARGEGTFRSGVGLNSGSVIVGNIGSPERMDYTVIGEDVNLAARLEGMNKEQGTTIILSDRTLKSMEANSSTADFNIRSLGAVPVRGFEEPIPIYTVDGWATKETPQVS